MPSNLFLRNLYFLAICLCVNACASEEQNNPLGLAENHIFYQLENGSERDYNAIVSLEKIDDSHKLSIKGANGSDGLIITIKDIKTMTPQTLLFKKEVSVILNEKYNKDLNVYVSSACPNNSGSFNIVDWDDKNNTITGSFSGPICTRGVFAHIPSTKINEGAFYKLKYNVK